MHTHTHTHITHLHNSSAPPAACVPVPHIYTNTHTHAQQHAYTQRESEREEQLLCSSVATTATQQIAVSNTFSMLPFTINHRHKAHTASSPPHPHHQPIHVCAALHLVWLVVVLLLSPSIRWLHLPLPCRLLHPGCVSPQHTQAVQHRTIKAEHCMHNTPS